MKDKAFVAHIRSLKRPLIITINLLLRKPATSQIAIAVYELHSSPYISPNAVACHIIIAVGTANHVVWINIRILEHSEL